MNRGWRNAWRGDRERWCLLLAALALAASFVAPRVRWWGDAFEHVIVLDVTQSMNVLDQTLEGKPVSRLAFAKVALHHALDVLPCGSKVGWGIFTDNRSYLLFTPVEVCANRAELRATLANIDSRMAWAGNSEVAKALHSGIVVAKGLPGKPSLVFITDGHEAPPLHPLHRPPFDDKPGDVQGLIVGVGARQPSPIPKTDPSGRPLGLWEADEVDQVDVYSRGSGADGQAASVEDRSGASVAVVGATPGREHLSSMRESYLRLLAGENGLTFHHLVSASAFADALRDKALARSIEVPGDLRALFASLALVLLLLRHVGAWRKLRR